MEALATATNSTEVHHGASLCSLPQYSAFIKIIEFAAHELKQITSSSHVLHMEDSPPSSADSGVSAASSPKSASIVGVVKNSDPDGDRFNFDSSVVGESATWNPTDVPTSRARLRHSNST